MGGIRSKAGGVLASAERYEPGSGNWFAAADMESARAFLAAVLLEDGRVLVIGGHDSTSGPTEQPTAELYDPNGS